MASKPSIFAIYKKCPDIRHYRIFPCGCCLNPKKQPRALIITDVTMPGGVTTHIGQLARVARARGWHVSVLMDQGSGTDSMADSLRRLGVPVCRGSLYHGHYSDEEIRRAVHAAFERDKPHVVHVQCGSPRSAVLPRELAIEASLPLVVTENYVTANYDIADDTLRRIRGVYRRSFAVISVCDENRSLLRERFGLYADRHVVVRYGVVLPPERVWSPRKSRRYRAICVARLTRQKGVEVLVRAVAELPPDLHAGLHFTLVGGGELEGQLKQLATDCAVGGRFDFIGWSDNVPVLLNNHDLFVLPSIAEGQPIALLEALAAGLPCIASAVSGIPEALGHGAYGALVTPNDPLSLRAAITSFYEDPTILQRKAAEARRHLQTYHDPDRNMGKVIQLWETAIAPQAARRWDERKGRRGSRIHTATPEVPVAAHHPEVAAKKKEE
jgi:glycosyltransferase involved in cell wall biosynthesis